MIGKKLKKISIGLLSIIFSCNINTSYAINKDMMRTPGKNYNNGYYYSHGVSERISDNKNWMAFIDDNKNISELSVPGTHDTMANYELTHMVRTQAISLKGQLDSGIRFLDIRCNYNDNQFKINHGPIGLKYNFDDVLNTVSKFLDENPTESVFMRIKQEHSKYSDYEFDKKLKEYESKYSKYFWKNTSYTNNPKLGDVRGKIVVFNDVFGSTVGLDYRSTDKQDNYSLDTNWSLYYKWEDIKNHLNKTRNGNKNKIYINYLSASGGSFPYFVASGQSSPEMSAPRLATGLVGPAYDGWYPDFPRGPLNDILFEGTNILTTSNIINNKGRVGIIVADFPGKGLIDSIISKNDFGTNNYISIGGVNYNGDKEVEGLKININYYNKYLFLTNRINEKIHAGFGNNKYFKLKLLDKNNKEKTSIELMGNDIPSDSKYDKLNFIKFEFGDIIEIYHEEPFRVNLNVSIAGEQDKNNKIQKYRITENGLQSLERNNPLPNAIYKVNLGLDKNYFLATNKYSSYIEKPVMTSTNMKKWDESNWLFDYDSSKDAYTIKHIGTDEYITHNNEKVIVKGKPTDNSYYWIVKKHSDGKYSFINLDTNLCFDIPGGIVYKDIIPYEYNASENQKFILEKQ